MSVITIIHIGITFLKSGYEPGVWFYVFRIIKVYVLFDKTYADCIEKTYIITNSKYIIVLPLVKIFGTNKHVVSIKVLNGLVT
jgi:hypothetical protein